MKRVELEASVLKWAMDRSLLNSDNVVKQTLKTLSEAGELADAVAKNDKVEIVDAIGDIEVCLIILKAQLGLPQNTPLHKAYDEIKDRKGKTVGGTFIKEE